MLTALAAPIFYFNPRSREGSDANIHAHALHVRFQSTLPGRERPASAALRQIAQTFQSTLPGRERHAGRLAPLPFRISIHAPGKGATPVLAVQVQTGKISIHAPGKGATRMFLLAVLRY